MLVMNTVNQKYIAFSRTRLSNNEGSDYSLDGIFSSIISKDLSYISHMNISEEQLKTVNRDIYDVFKYQEVEVNLYSYPVQQAAKEASTDSHNYYSSVLIEHMNKYLKRNNYPEIIEMHHCKRVGLTATHVLREIQKSKKFKIFAILKDSLQYIPTDKHPEPALKRVGALKIFNMMYAPSLEKGLASMGLPKYDYSDFAELQQGGDIINLTVRVEETFSKELFKTLQSLKPEILNKMFDGKLKKLLEANKMSVDDVFNALVDRLNDSFGQLDLKINTKDIL